MTVPVLTCLAALAAAGDALVASVQPNGTRTVSVSVAGRPCELPDGSSAVRGSAVTEDGRYVLFTHNLARYHLPATQMDRGWMNTAALSVFDAVSGRRVNTVLLDDPLVGAANPWGVAVNGKWIAVAHAGTHEVSLIPRAALFEKLRGYDGEATGDLGFMQNVGRKRIALKGKGTREVRFRPDGKLEVRLHFAEVTAVVDPETGTVKEPDVPDGLSDAVRADPVRKGEHYFNDATVCFQKWQSCASCHPDGLTDGLTWDFPFSGGGLGHPELTPDLSKIRKFMPRRTRQGDFHILLYSASKEIGEAVDAYVRSLAPVAEPKDVSACFANPSNSVPESAMLRRVTDELTTGDLPQGSKLLRGSCTTPDGKYTYLVHTIGRFWLPVTQVDRGWCHNAAMSVFDAKSGKYLNTVLLDDLDRGAAEPWDVICDEREIVVAHAGSSELSFIDRKAFEAKLEAAQGKDLSTDMSFLAGIRLRRPTAKQGPRKLKFRDGRATVTEYFEDKPGVTKGELLFNDARLCFQQWQSCATCHPDGGTDGMEWSFPRTDGFGAPEETCDLVNLVYEKTPRARRTKRDAEVALFATLDEETAAAMAEYVRSVMKHEEGAK